MAARARPIATAPRPAGLDPLRFTWSLFSNVKFALLLVGLAATSGLLAVVFPQVPGPMRTNPAARSAWLEMQRHDFGVFTGSLDGLGLFDVYHTAWFNGLWAVIIVAVTVCTVSRFRPTWRSVQHPVQSVPDTYFERAHHRANFSHGGGDQAVQALLRKRHYRVVETRRDDTAVYFFAERYPWSQYGTFLSHLALLLLLVGALLTRFGGFARTIVLAEGTPAATVFNQPGPGQLFVRMVDAVRGLDPSGNIVDFRSRLEVRRGDEVVTCTATVNDPCEAFGYKVHQAAFFDDIARLRVTGPDGRVVFDNVVDFDSQTTPVPVLRVTDPLGTVLFDQALPQMDTDQGSLPGRADDRAVSLLSFPRSVGTAANGLVTHAVSWRVAGREMGLVVEDTNGVQRELPARGELVLGAYRIAFTGVRRIPALRVQDLPGAITGDGSTTIQMPIDGAGAPYLLVNGLDADNLVLQRDRPVTSATGFTYTFRGQVEASGVDVRRDPGDTFIWVAVGMALVGLGITFYVPRRRLWVKVSEGRTAFAGVAERTTRFGRELRFMGASLGSQDALLPGDLEEP